MAKSTPLTQKRHQAAEQLANLSARFGRSADNVLGALLTHINEALDFMLSVRQAQSYWSQQMKTQSKSLGGGCFGDRGADRERAGFGAADKQPQCRVHSGG
jgi:hypothetical protein